MKASEWIDRVKAVKGIESDYGAAKVIGLSRQSISGYRNGKFTFDEESSIKVAHVLGEKPEVVMLDQFAERTKNPAARNALFGLANGISIVSKTAMVAIVVVALYPLDSSASGIQVAVQKAPSVYYVK